MKLAEDDKVECRTPAVGRDGITRIPRWKYQAVRTAILAAMAEQNGGAIGFNELRNLAKTHMQKPALDKLGSWGWHFTTVKLNMEVEGEIIRAAGKTPQQLTLGL